MLKIKADRMKDLEQVGFEKIDNYYSSKKYSYVCRFGYSINKIIIDKNGILHFNTPTKPVYDFLYDLITSGMVEKVVEDENHNN